MLKEIHKANKAIYQLYIMTETIEAMGIPCKDETKYIMDLMVKGILLDLDLDCNEVNYNLMYDAVWENGDIQDKFEFLLE